MTRIDEILDALNDLKVKAERQTAEKLSLRTRLDASERAGTHALDALAEERRKAAGLSRRLATSQRWNNVLTKAVEDAGGQADRLEEQVADGREALKKCREQLTFTEASMKAANSEASRHCHSLQKALGREYELNEELERTKCALTIELAEVGVLMKNVQRLTSPTTCCPTVGRLRIPGAILLDVDAYALLADQLESELHTMSPAQERVWNAGL